MNNKYESEELVNLTCECGNTFERPLKYKTYNENYPNVVFRWKLKYCDVCYDNKVKSALKKLPKILNAIINEQTKPNDTTREN